MRRIFMSASFLLCAALPAASIAQPMPDTTAPTVEREEPALAAEPEQPDEAPVIITAEREEVVCRRERPTGSRVAVKVCRTEKALREEQLATQQVITELQLAGGPPVTLMNDGVGDVGAEGFKSDIPVANPF